MADVLKDTLWWSANPGSWTVTDTGQTGSFSEATVLTAAGAHDSVDTTMEQFTDTGDLASKNPNFTATVDKTLIAAPAGGIKFIRIKWRGRCTKPSGSGTADGSAQPRINGVGYGSTQVLTTSFANYQADFTTDPADGLAWTKAKIDTYTFGLRATGLVTDGAYSTSIDLRVSEYTLEVWGEDVVVAATPGTSIANAGTVIAQGGIAEVSTGDRDPTAVVPLATSLDVPGELVTVRSANSTLNDQSLTTKTTNTGTNGSGTFIRDLGGLLGSSALHGIGLIGGVKIWAIVRASKSDTATLGTFRFGTAMGLKTLVADPTVYDYDAGLTNAMWATVESALITTGAFGVAFEWGSGVNSVWANFVSPTWDFRATWTAGAAKTAQIEVAEAWIEVHGPIGSEPEVIELRQVFGEVRKRLEIATEV